MKKFISILSEDKEKVGLIMFISGCVGTFSILIHGKIIEIIIPLIFMYVGIYFYIGCPKKEVIKNVKLKIQ